MGRWALTLVIVESRGGAHFTVELKVVLLVMKNPQTALFYAIVVMRKSGMKDTF